jgi:hypothetical protein
MLQCSVRDDEASSAQVLQLLLKLAVQISNFYIGTQTVFNNQHQV